MGLVVHSVALEMVREIRPLIEQIARHDRSLSKQLRACVSSVALNIGEGAHSCAGNERSRFESAAGSANETRSALQVAEAWGYIAQSSLEAVDDKLDRILAMLWRLRHRK